MKQKKPRCMEHLPIEIIGYILSRLEEARDVVVASVTCRKWQKAMRNYLHSLSFNFAKYHYLTSTRFEVIVTRTIFQTDCLKCLSINGKGLSARSVMAWLMYTRKNIRQLHFSGWSTPDINIIEECARGNLEDLELNNGSITVVDPVYLKFPFLHTLSLSRVSISALDLSLLVSACPKLVKIALEYLDIATSDARRTVRLKNANLKDILVGGIWLNIFIILEVDAVENMQLVDSLFEGFELVNKGTLKHFTMYNVRINHIDITGNLEDVYISDFYTNWSSFHRMISRSSSLKRLTLWNVNYDHWVVDHFETISSSCPQLSHMSLWDPKFDHLNGSFRFKNMIVLEIVFDSTIEDFSHIVEVFVESCPNLRTLIIKASKEEFSELTSVIDNLKKKYMHVETELQTADWDKD